MYLSKIIHLSFWTLILLFKTIAFAQYITPQSINASGKEYVQSVGYLTFRLGELQTLQSSGNGNTLNSGFSATGITVSTIHPDDSQILDIKVFPNPVSEFLNIKIIHSNLDELSLSIVDLLGSEVYQSRHKFVPDKIGINAKSFPSGTYTLILKSKSEIISTHKIVKQ
jgi:hypothetical protein